MVLTFTTIPRSFDPPPNDQVSRPDVEGEVCKVEQSSVPGFEFDDVQWPRPRHKEKRDALAEVVEIGRRCVQGVSLHLLG